MRNAVTRKTNSSTSDWRTKTFTVRTIREQKVLDKTKTKLWGFSFLGHPFFLADLSFAPITSRTRSTHLGSQLGKMFNSDGLELLNINKPGARGNGMQDNSIIELSNIQNSDTLADHPLTINIDESLSGDGNVIPITMKEGFVIPFGDSMRMEDGSTQIVINKIPEGTDIPPSQQGKRSFGRSIWFSLLKVAGLKDDIFKIQKVNFEAEGDMRLPISKSDVAKANKILVVVHGLIGDTKNIIKHLEFLKEEEHYDLILTFDYENLNTKIEDIAGHFNQNLEALGLSSDDGKQLDILAHSMGGLVSRYLIEHIRQGDNLVDRLVMVGTPNGGSIIS